MSLLIAWAVTVPGVFLAGFAIGCQYRARVPRHRHIWEPWELGRMRVVSETGKFLYTQSTQERRCLDCGYTQRERVVAG